MLADLDVNIKAPERVIEVWNKVDLLPPEHRPPRTIPATPGDDSATPQVVTISAITGEGLPDLLNAIEQRLTAARRTYTVELTGESLRLLHRLYEFGEVMERNDTADGTTVARVRVSPDRESAFQKSFPDAKGGG